MNGMVCVNFMCKEASEKVLYIKRKRPSRPAYKYPRVYK